MFVGLDGNSSMGQLDAPYSIRRAPDAPRQMDGAGPDAVCKQVQRTAVKKKAPDIVQIKFPLVESPIEKQRPPVQEAFETRTLSRRLVAFGPRISSMIPTVRRHAYPIPRRLQH